MLFKNTQSYQIAFGKKIAHVGGTIELDDKDLENPAVKELVDNKLLVPEGATTAAPVAKPAPAPEPAKKVEPKKSEPKVSEPVTTEKASADKV